MYSREMGNIKMNENTILYLIVKQGVGIKGVFGCYTSLSKAKARALFFSENDVDNWHSWDVYRIELNKDYPHIISGQFDYGKAPEDIVLLASYTKPKEAQKKS